MSENYLKKELYELIKVDPGVFEFIQEGALDGIWYWDIEKPENEWMSPKFWEVMGYDPAGKTHSPSEWQGIINQSDLKTALDNFEKHCIDPSHPYDQIVRYVHENGSTVWIRCRGIAIRDENGKPVRMLGAHTDITSLKEAETRVKQLTKEYELVFNGTQDALFLINVLEDGTFQYMRNNSSHEVQTGLSLDALAGKTPENLLGQEMGALVAANYQECVTRQERISYEETLTLPTGKRIWKTTLTPVMEKGVVDYIVGSAMDITEQKRLEEEMNRHAYYDALTGLPNRRLFFDRMERIALESKRDHEIFALLFMDLDGFKLINDTHGHEIGDKVLIAVSERLEQCVRKSDTVARMGGDEFTIILRDVNDMKSVGMIVQKIHDALKKPLEFGSISCETNSSIGVAIYPENGEDTTSLIKNADSAMYEIKKRSKGKGGIRFYKEDCI